MGVELRIQGSSESISDSIRNNIMKCCVHSLRWCGHQRDRQSCAATNTNYVPPVFNTGAVLDSVPRVVLFARPGFESEGLFNFEDLLHYEGCLFKKGTEHLGLYILSAVLFPVSIIPREASRLKLCT